MDDGSMLQGLDRVYMLGVETDDLPCEFYTFSEWKEMAKELGLVDIKTIEFPPKYLWSRGIIIISGCKSLQV